MTSRTRTIKTTYFEENVKGQFQFKDSNEWRTAVLISRSGKATGKYSKKWNSKVDDDRIRSIDFERDVDNLHIMSSSSVNTFQIPKKYSILIST